ncbi:Unknown protein, partial [Striga hermonthica]
FPRHVSTSGNVVFEADSPLAPELTAEALPAKVKIPQIGMYDGTSDPYAHLGHYTSWMDLHGASDALRCRMFSLTLGPQAQKWYYTLPPHSIWKWQQLRAAFRSHFIGAQICLIPKESITNIMQKDDETIKDYVSRFNDRIQNIEPCHPETLLVTTIAGLKPNSMFRWTLCQNKPATFQEFLVRAQQFIIAEESKSVPTPIGGIPVHRILVDTGAHSSILMLRTFKKLGLDPADIRPCNDQIQGFNGCISCPVGEILLPIRFGGFGPKSKIIMETFKVLDVRNEYNAVIGRTALYKLRAAVSIFHYALKFPTIEGECTHYGDQREARSLMLLSTSRNFHMIEEQDTDNSIGLDNPTLNAERTDKFAPDTDISLADTDVPMTSILPETLTEALDQEQPFHEKDIGIHEDMDPRMQFKDGSHHIWAEPVEDVETIYVDGSTQEKSLRIGANLQEPLRSSLIQFLQSNSDVFARKHEDMKGIDLQKACHRLNLDKTVKPVIQKRQKFGPDRQKALEEEVNKLIDNKFVKEAKYPTWISNLVLVEKATGLWRLCIDFSDLNQACPIDRYPIPHIDYMVDATSGHRLMSFLDTYSGYNQIPMHPDDAEHTSFYSARGLYCYVMMTFGLKNVGATYQRLVNKMFACLIGHTMEVYVDDMLVKSEQASDHIAHLSEVFDILREYSMVHNPKKCTFGVGSGKFLGYMVSQRGIEANPAKIQAILELAPPTSSKSAQALTGRLAALNRFILKSKDHCKPFFDAIRKKKPCEWTVECQNAFDNIKEVLSRLLTLQKPLPDEPLYLYPGVSDVAVSAVLIRQDGLQQFPIYYISKALHDVELRYPYMEKLAFALIIAARKLRPYFLEHSII